MKSWFKVCTLAALFVMSNISARANAPDPSIYGRKGARVNAQMHIEPNTKATEARLLIPRAVWQQMRAGLDAEGGQHVAGVFAAGGAQTAMAGIFLSLAFAFGGVWFVRQRKHAANWTRAALGVALLALCGATASIAYANAGPPPVARSLTSGILSPGAQPYGAYGQVKVEISDEESQITLVLPVAKTSGD